MAINSSGYDGYLYESDQVVMAPKYGVDYYVEDPGHFAATPADGARALAISPGNAGGRGVRDRMADSDTLYFDSVPSGSRWDLVVLRRDWQPLDGGPSSLQIVKGTSAKSIPGGRKNTPGTEDDQPLWLVRLDAGSTAIGALVDLRCFYANGNLIAKDDLARQYLGIPGTRVNIGDKEWLCGLTTSNIAEWVEMPGRADKILLNGAAVLPTSGSIAVRDTGGRVKVGTPTTTFDAATKLYVDQLIDDVVANTLDVMPTSFVGRIEITPAKANEPTFKTISFPAGLFKTTPVVMDDAEIENPADVTVRPTNDEDTTSRV